jgi:hypothetical protein
MGYGDSWRTATFKNGWFMLEYGDLFHAIEDPEASKTAPAAVTHWMIIGAPE